MRLPITRWLLYVLILAFPFFGVEPKFARPDWWAGALLILLFGLSVLLTGRLRVDPIGQTALGLHAVVLLSLAVNFWGWEEAQWKEFFTLWAQLVFATLLYFALANLQLSLDGLRSVFRWWIGVAVIVALYALYQTLARNIGGPLAYLPYLHPKKIPSGLAFAGYVRPSSFLREPTYLGLYLLGPVLFTGTLLSLRQDRAWLWKSRRSNAVAFTVILLAFMASFALSGYITIGAVMLFGLLVHPRLRKPLIRIGGGFVIGMATLFLVSKALRIPYAQAVEERVARVAATVLPVQADRVDPSTRVRVFEVSLALKVWSHHPLFGVGLNQLQFVGAQYVPEDAAQWQKRLAARGYTHNMWLTILSQLGAIGFLLFGLLWIQGLRMMHFAFRRTYPIGLLQGPALGLFYVLLASMIRGLMGGAFTFVLYWFYLGMASVVYKISRREHGTLVMGQH